MALPSGVIIHLRGPQGVATATRLAARLTELGAPAACDKASVQLEHALTDRVDFAVDPSDSPDFAADKALDLLEKKGYVTLDAPQLSEEEETVIRERLRRLGYVE